MNANGRQNASKAFSGPHAKALEELRSLSRSKSGFTLYEVLAALVVLVLLLALIIPGIFALQRDLRQRELDAKAEIIFNAAQNQMTSLRASGNASLYQKAVGRATKIENTPSDRAATLDDEGGFAEQSTLYAMSSLDRSRSNTVASSVMTDGVVEFDLLDNGWVVEYDPTSGSVYAVFYSETDNFATYSSDWSTYDDLRYRDNRLDQGAIVGYYGGDSVSSSNTSRLEPTMRVTNGEKLSIVFYCSLPQGVSRNDHLLFTITFGDSEGHEYETTYSVDSSVNPLLKRGRSYMTTVVLDDLSSQDTRFDKLYGSQSGHGEGCLVPGDVLNVKLKVESENRLIQPWTGSVATNGLFADASNNVTDASGHATTAVIECGRHLQNLDVLHGQDGAANPNPNVTRAELAKSIAFGETLSADDWYHIYTPETAVASAYFNGNDPTTLEPCFKPIYAPDLVEFSGGRDEQGKLFTISGLNAVGSTGAASGLFAQIEGMSIHDVALTGAHVVGSGDTGAFAGTVVGSDNELKNCLVYLDQSDLWVEASSSEARLSGKCTGGLVGRLAEGASLTVEDSLAATVETGLADGMGTASAGGLVGCVDAGATLDVKTSYADSYIFGDDVTGGLVGTVAETAQVSFDSCYAAGFLYGSQQFGLAGGPIAQASKTYTICSSDFGTLTYSTATGIASASNVYYLFGSGGSTNNVAGTESIGVMSGADMLEQFGGASDDGFTLAEATHAYNLKDQGLFSYTYPRLSANHHYGDWAASFASGVLVYYERYGANGLTGFFGANVEKTLRDDGVVVGDGYGIVYSEDDPLPASVTVTIEGYGEHVINPSSSTYYEVRGSDDKTYRVYPLPKEALNGDEPSGSDSFYRQITLQAAGAIETQTCYVNPWFCMTPRYVQSASDPRPTLDSAVTVRTPRHLYSLCEHQDWLASVAGTATYSQGRDIDYSTYDWNAFYRAGSGSIQKQAPIGDTGRPFTATYDGGCHLISNLSIQAPHNDCVGLFGYNEGTVTNVVLWCNYGTGENHTLHRTTVDDTNVYVHMGTLVGYNAHGATVRNCAVAGYYLAGREGVISAYPNSNLSVGGLVGTNAGTIKNCSVDCPGISLSTLDAQVYAGGFAGKNESTGTISDCYSLGYLNVLSSIGGKVRLSGFSGGNSGVIRSSYCTTSLIASGTATDRYAFTTDGGVVTSCRYLGYGTFTYTGALRFFDSDQIGPGQVVTRGELVGNRGKAIADSGHVKTYTAYAKEGGYPYRAVVRDRASGGNWVHYGDWQGESNLGTMGLFYWEHEEYGTNDGYHLTYLGQHEGQAVGGTTICNAHDDGGVIVEYGYGYFARAGQAEESVHSELENMSFSGLADGEGAINQAAKAGLERQISQYEFFPYTTRIADTGDYVYLSSDDPTVRAGTWTVRNGSDEIAFDVAPFFANAMSYQDEDLVLHLAGEDGIVKQYGGEGGAPGEERNEYEVRSLQQLQYINWNSVTQNTSQYVNDSSYTNYPYLQYAARTGYVKQTEDEVYALRSRQYWRQSHDLDAVEGETFDFTPIAASASASKTDNREVVLYAWFGGGYDGGSYKVQNIDITSDSYTVGMFGVTVGADLHDIILYSDRGNTIKRETPASGGQINQSPGAYSLGGLVGIAYDYQTKDNPGTIRNCAIAGYNIVDASSQQHRQGGGTVGGLLGVGNVKLENSSAVTSIHVNCTHDNGRATYGDYIRVGGLMGSAQYSVDNCYSGGSIDVGRQTIEELYNKASGGKIPFDSAVEVDRQHNVHIYIAGIAGSAYTSNFINFTATTNAYDGKGVFNNCYTYTKLPNMEGTIKGVSYIAGPADRFGIKDAEITMNNCYYLNAVNEGITYTSPSYWYKTTNPKTYKMTDEDFEKILNGDLSPNKKLLYPDAGNAKITGTPNSIDYTELRDNGVSRLDLGGTGAWNTVTVTEGEGASIPGKYSFPGSGHPELQGKDYPFPTAVTQEDIVFGGTVNVHYGAWPLDGVYWAQGQPNMDVFADMTESGWAEAEFALIDPNGSFGGEVPELEDFQIDAGGGSFAQVVDVRADDTEENVYWVKVRALGEGAVTLRETKSGVSASCTLRITANLEIVATPSPVKNYRNNDELPDSDANGKTTLELEARSAVEPSKDYSSSSHGSWSMDFDTDLLDVAPGATTGTWTVTHHEHGVTVLSAIYDFNNGHYSKTVQANVPVKTYGVIGVGLDSDLVQTDRFVEAARQALEGTVTGGRRSAAADAPELPSGVEGDFFLYESVSDLDLNGSALNEASISSVSVSCKLDGVDTSFDYSFSDPSVNRGFRINLDPVASLPQDSSFQYRPGTISYSGPAASVSDVTLAFTVEHPEDSVSGSPVDYELPVSLLIPKFRASFDADGGTGYMKDIKVTGESIELPECSFSLVGHEFGGWEVEGDTSGTLYQPGDTFTFTSSVTFKAHWIPYRYTVHFEKNSDGVSGDMADQEFTYGEAQNLRENAFSKDGYRFMGWSKSSSGSIVYEDEQEVINLSSEKDATVRLYAVWAAEHTLTLENPLGTSQEFFVYNGHTETLEGYNEPTKTDFKLLGWFTAETDGTKVLDADGSIAANVDGYTRDDSFYMTEDKTLYAQWEEQSVYLSGNHSTVKYMISTLEDRYTKPVKQKTASNCYVLLDGWYRENTGDGGTMVLDAEGKLQPGQTLVPGETLHARWEQMPRSDYDPNGEKWIDTVKFDYEAGDTLVVEMDTTNCVGRYRDNIIGFGLDISSAWAGQKGFEVYYPENASNSLMRFWVLYMNGTNSGAKNISMAAGKVTLTFNKSDGVLINGVAFDASVRKDAKYIALMNAIQQAGEIKVGSQEGANRSHATDYTIKVIGNYEFD